MKKLIVFLLFMTSIANAQIEKVEPPFWYAGMQHSAVQILFYGKDISQYQVSASNNIAITDIKKTENRSDCIMLLFWIIPYSLPDQP